MRGLHFDLDRRTAWSLSGGSDGHQVGSRHCALCHRSARASLLVVGMMSLGVTCASIRKSAGNGVARQDLPIRAIEDPAPCWASGLSLASAQTPITDAVLTCHSREHKGFIQTWKRDLMLKYGFNAFIIDRRKYHWTSLGLSGLWQAENVTNFWDWTLKAWNLCVMFCYINVFHTM